MYNRGLTVAQYRAGKALAQLSVRELADKTGISPTSISGFAVGHVRRPRDKNLALLRQTLEDCGVEFGDDGWVRMAPPDSEAPSPNPGKGGIRRAIEELRHEFCDSEADVSYNEGLRLLGEELGVTLEWWPTHSYGIDSPTTYDQKLTPSKSPSTGEQPTNWKQNMWTNKNKTYLICSCHRDLYVADVDSYDPATKVAALRNCRHLTRWFCRVPGGLTSLCQHGPSAGTRCADPAPRSLLGDIVAIHELSDGAARAFAELAPSAE